MWIRVIFACQIMISANCALRQLKTTFVGIAKGNTMNPDCTFTGSADSCGGYPYRALPK